MPSVRRTGRRVRINKMTVNSHSSTLIAQIESYLKLFVYIGAAIYGVGFLVVSVHLSVYHVTPYSLLRLQYALAGVWLLFPLLVGFSILFIFKSFQGLFNRIIEKQKLNWMLFVFFKTLSIVFIIAWFVVIADMCYVVFSSLLPSLFSSFILLPLREFFLISFLYGSLAFLCFCSFLILKKIRNKENSFSNREFRLGVTTLVTTIILTTLIFFVVLGSFARFIYARIPCELGGGCPIKVQFIIKKDNQGEQIARMLGMNEKHDLSPKLQLLLTTDKSYVIVHPSAERASIVVPKDRVTLALFGAYKEKQEAEPNMQGAGEGK
jgi:hypothetical protein